MTRRGLVLFALMSVIWGIPYLFIRVAVAEITPATLVFARTAIAAAILLPIALLRVDLRPVLRRWRWVVAFAAVEIAIPWVLLDPPSSTSRARSPASSSRASRSSAPRSRSRPEARTGSAGRACFGLLVGIVGVAAIVGGDFEASDATALLQVGRRRRRLRGRAGHPVAPPGRACRRSGSWPCRSRCAPSSTRRSRLVQWPSAVPSTNALASVAILAVVCTAAAFMLFAALIGEIGPVRATVITYVNPAVAAVLGVLVLQETFTVAMAIGFALVILGSSLATRPSRAVPGRSPTRAEPAFSPAQD